MHLLASGKREEVLPALKDRHDRDAVPMAVTFSDQSGRPVDFDLSGTLEDVLRRYAPVVQRSGPGRPKLGVVAREVSLLPRHWEWLEQQSGGASASIRKLVEEARKRDPEEQRARTAIETTERFLTAVAGNLPGYEEVTRALYARNRARFDELIVDWPPDVRVHANRLLDGSF